MLTWLRTVGKSVVNEAGETVYLRGAALGGIQEPYPQPAYWQGVPTSLNAFVSETEGKANVLRVPMSPWNYWNHYVTDNPDAILLCEEAMDMVVNFCVANDIYVSVDFHGVPNDQYHIVGEDPTPWINWMLHWANRYKDIPNVIYELWNEPYIQALGNGDTALGRQRWISMVERCCTAILEVNPRALMIVNVDDVVVKEHFLQNPLPYNVIYAFGFYMHHLDQAYYRKPYIDGNYDLVYERLKSFFFNEIRIDDFYNANLPLMCKEFGWYLNAYPPDFPIDVNMQHVFGIWSEYSIHWYQWIWWLNPGNYGLCNPDWTLVDPVGVVWAKSLSGVQLYKLTVNSVPSGIPFMGKVV